MIFNGFLLVAWALHAITPLSHYHNYSFEDMAQAAPEAGGQPPIPPRVFDAQWHQRANEVAKELLDCIICYNQMKPDDNLLLPCNHTFHRSCLARLVRYIGVPRILFARQARRLYSLKCPMCQTEHRMTWKKLGMFKKNEFLKEMYISIHQGEAALQTYRQREADIHARRLRPLNPDANPAGYPCNMCPRVFRSEQTLQNHIVVFHTKEYPFQCRLCPKGYVSMLAFKEHVVKYHPHQVAEDEIAIAEREIAEAQDRIDHGDAFPPEEDIPRMDMMPDDDLDDIDEMENEIAFAD